MGIFTKWFGRPTILDAPSSLKPYLSDIPKAMRSRAVQLANAQLGDQNAADQLREEAQKRMRGRRFEEAIPFALAEGLRSEESAAALVRVGMCFLRLAEGAATSKGKLNKTERHYLDLSILTLTVIIDFGYLDSSVYCLRGAGYTLRSQIRRSRSDLDNAEADFKKALEANPSDDEKRDAMKNLGHVESVRNRLFG